MRPSLRPLVALALLVALACPTAASAKSCPAISAGGDGAYTLAINASGGLGCAAAKGILRDFWFKKGRVKHGGPTNAKTHYTLRRWAGWRCAYHADGGSCRRGSKRATYDVHASKAPVPIPPTSPATTDPVARAPIAGSETMGAILAGIPQHGLELGDPAAALTIVVFIDLQCPFCRFYALDEEPKVIEQLVRTGVVKIRLAPIALPQMGEDSEAARTVLARLAARNRAWNFAGLFFFNQGEEGTGYVTNAFLQRLVDAVPGSLPSDAAREPDAGSAALLRQTDRLSEHLRVTGTPSFAIGTSAQDPGTYELLELGGAGSAADQLIAAARSR